MKNSDQFLASFSSIEGWLRARTASSSEISFSKMISIAALEHRVVARYEADLRQFAKLRNAIVHDRAGGHVIAEPNDRAVTDLQRIESTLSDPAKLIPKFAIDVISREMNDSIGSAVTDMRHGAFSQIPITKDGRVVAVLTSETVARWLAAELDNEIVSLKDTPIESVLNHTEDEDYYCFLKRDQTLHDALEIFENYASRGKVLDAVLISHNGRPEDKLLGMLTVFDLPKILDELGLKKISAA